MRDGDQGREHEAGAAGVNEGAGRPAAGRPATQPAHVTDAFVAAWETRVSFMPFYLRRATASSRVPAPGPPHASAPAAAPHLRTNVHLRAALGLGPPC